ncbi:ADAT2 [Hepatospora eriocheir]|uniref:ADAT2 n=1 Tax=Hepatospora eriocheir TaxID=1081669 RepID=A0A1X0QE95_9MICR|nr:ADAT2 [Hepatospora eriocheir]
MRNNYINLVIETALNEAEIALLEGEVPVSCVMKFGNIIIKTHNTTNKSCDPLKHCELDAIREYQRFHMSNTNDIIMFITLEPCTMCCRIITDFKERFIKCNLKLFFGVYNDIFGNLKITGNTFGECIYDERCIEIIKRFYEQQNPNTVNI